METTAAIPKTMDAMNNNNREKLAFPSLHDIETNQEKDALDRVPITLD